MNDNLHGRECKCCSKISHGVAESMEEMDFQRSLGGACVTGDLERVKKLIAMGADVNSEDASGFSPLHYASRNAHLQACSLLLNNGALVNKRIRSSQATSLHRAAYAGHEGVVKVLLESGADPCAQDSDGNTALHKAVQQGHQRIASIILNANTKVSDVQDNKGLLPRDCMQMQ